MLWTSFLCLLSLSLLPIISSNDLRQIRFNKGEVPLSQVYSGTRNLDDPSTPQSIYFDTSDALQTVDVNFGTNYTAANSISITPTMLLMTYTSQTALTSSQPEFQKYNCSAPCSQSNNTFQYYWPYMNDIKATQADNITLSISNGAWSLNTSAVFLSNLTYDQSYLRKTQAYGWIGLGTSGDAAKNFQGDHPVFAISFDSTDTSEGILAFGKNTGIIDARPSLGTLSTDDDWKLTVVSVTIATSNTGTSMGLPTTPMIFDIQYGAFEEYAFALPDACFNAFFSTLQGFNATCDTKTDVCYYTGSISNLPNLTLNLADGGKFTISPSLYMFETADQGYETYFSRFKPLQV